MNIVLPEYKSDKYYREFIGRYFRTKTDKSCASVFMIESFDQNTRMFKVDHYYATLGNCKYESLKMYYCFVDSDNYEETSEYEYKAMQYLFANEQRGVKRIDRVCKDILMISNDDFAEMEEIIEQQLNYINPLRMATTGYKNQLGRHNRDVVNKLRELKEILEAGANIKPPNSAGKED